MSQPSAPAPTPPVTGMGGLLDEVHNLDRLIVHLGALLATTTLAADVERMQVRARDLSPLLAEYLEAADDDRRRLRHDTLNVLGAVAGYAELIGDDVREGMAHDLTERIQGGAHALSAMLAADREAAG
ncbi:hypothetical protein [Roseospirillum parvum]|uniref:Uncharacterized protein n=1 Tax=Roseospirillum parvum TaxID=83401 RepID=A0A1G8BVH9_9PROT|nr:hypothetical protein [Roseospirillum parvum]SDH37073.1 hypothetical protein SAMN05421742_106130 [Roseospirillum parvum]